MKEKFVEVDIINDKLVPVRILASQRIENRKRIKSWNAYEEWQQKQKKD